MRLTERARHVIKDSVSEIFGPSAIVKLFCSRTDVELKGGDIDLLIECPAPVAESGLKTAKVSARIQRQLGQQKIDILCTWPGAPLSPVHISAIKNGILL